MNKLRYWFSSKKRQMAKLHDLQRQLQEAWEERDGWKAASYSWREACENITEQLHRVARQRDEERRQRRLADIRLQKALESASSEEE